MLDLKMLTIYLEQKNVLADRLAELTDKMEQQCQSEEESLLADLLANRQQIMQRIGKCDEQIANLLAVLSEEEQADLRLALRGEETAQGDWSVISEPAQAYRKKIQKIWAQNQAVQQMLTARHAEVKDRLNQVRYASSGGETSMIHR